MIVVGNGSKNLIFELFGGQELRLSHIEFVYKYSSNVDSDVKPG